MAETLPRYTRFWGKQAKMLADSDAQTFSNRIVQLRLMRTVELLAAEVGLGIIWKDKADVAALSIIRRPGETLDDGMAALVDAYLERSSAADRFSREELTVHLAWRVEWELRFAAGEDRQVLIEEAKERGPKKLTRLLPDNPIELQVDGDARGTDKARAEHLLQLAEYHRSLRAPGRPGRPRGAAIRPKMAKRLDAEEALKAARMKDDGAHWTAIAKALLPSFDSSNYNRRYRDKIRKHVDRLIERGHLEGDRLQAHS